MPGLQKYRRPVHFLAAINVFAFALLYFFKKPYDQYVLLAGLMIIGVIYLAYFVIVKQNLGDEYLFLIVAMLSSLGVVMLYRLEPSYGFKQIIWFAGGMGLFFLSYYIYRKIHHWEQFIYLYPLASFLLFALTLVLGTSIKGAKNWIVFGPLSFQPSEVIKVLFIFFLAAYFAQPERLAIKQFKWQNRVFAVDSKYVAAAIAYVHLCFLVIQREFGTVLLFWLIMMTLFYVFDSDRKFLLLNTVLAAVGGTLGLLFVTHVQVRVQTWLDPWTDIAGKGYQITQSLFGIGSGGFFGRGIGMGSPEYIPEVHTDFIFSAICEEMGIFGGIAIILLYYILVYRGIKITLSVNDPFRKTLALGLTAMFGFQTFIIIGGVIKLIPLTGITLPFISYGGSSLVTSFIALGILQAISRLSTEEEEEIARAAAQ